MSPPAGKNKIYGFGRSFKLQQQFILSARHTSIALIYYPQQFRILFFASSCQRPRIFHCDATEMGNTHSSHRWGRWYKTRTLAPRDEIPTFDVTGRSFLESKTRTYTVYHGGALIGMGAAAGALLLISALLTGLILAICGLDMAWLKMRGITGDAKQRWEVALLLTAAF